MADEPLRSTSAKSGRTALTLKRIRDVGSQTVGGRISSSQSPPIAEPEAMLLENEIALRKARRLVQFIKEIEEYERLISTKPEQHFHESAPGVHGKVSSPPRPELDPLVFFTGLL